MAAAAAAVPTALKYMYQIVLKFDRKKDLILE